MSGTMAGPASFGDRYAVVHDIAGPRVRLGVLWTATVALAFLLGSAGLAAVFGLTAAVAALQVVGRWKVENRLVAQVVAAGGASAVVVAATIGLRPVGLALIAATAASVVVPAVFVVGGTGADDRSSPTPAGAAAWLAAAGPVLGPVVFAGLAGAAAVQVDRSDAVAFLFLLGAVSVYDAGDFLCGAGYRSRIVGPGAGVIGVLAVTAAMFLAEPPPFEGGQTIVAGVVVAVACPLGQLLGSWLLPDPRAKAPGLRRLDGWMLSAPAFLVTLWWVGG